MKFRSLFTLILLASLLAALLGLVRVQVAHAAQTLTVTDCSNDSQLQADVSTANSDNAGDIITFSCGGDIMLTSTLFINGSMTLDGSGQQVTLDGQHQRQVLNSGVTLTLKALTIANGSGTGSTGGGGLYNKGGTVSISNSTFSGNSALSLGGGLYNNFGTVSISNSTFSGNSANGSNASGGGLYNNGGTVSISNSTFSGNSALSLGGGLYNNGGTMSISNSTFANNSATVGGGLDNFGTVSITNSTFANNSAAFVGGGLDNNGTLAIGGSIVANNTGGDCINFRPFTDQEGYNLESGTDCGFTGTGDLQNTDPKLASALASNGGPTQTLALLDGSPAIDHIPAASCPATDQRGDPRPDNAEATCDMGAYEFIDPVDNDLGLSGLPANITTNATSPRGAVVTYTPPTVVDEDSPLPAVSCTPTSGSTFAIGTTTVTCTVSDSDDTPSSVSQTFTVTVKGAAAQVSDLITTVQGLPIASGLKASLVTQLQAVLADLQANNTAQACLDLTSFINHVNAQSGKGLTTTQANQLLTAANRIKAVLAC